MRFVTIGRNEDGRSYVAEVREVLADRSPGGDIATDRMWTTKEFPPELPVILRRDDEEARPTSSQGATTSWTMAEFAANRSSGMHCTDTLDYQTVLRGAVTLHLEDGEIELQQGDAVMMPGVLHSWTAGPEGCILNVVNMPAR